MPPGPLLLIYFLYPVKLIKSSRIMKAVTNKKTLSFSNNEKASKSSLGLVKNSNF